MTCRCEDILRVTTLPDPCASGLCVGQQAQLGDALYELVFDPTGDCGRAWKLLADGGTGSINVQDEGILVGTRPTLNFIGPGVTATDDAPDNRIDITITAAVVGFGNPTTILPDDAPDPGVSSDAARADHRHGIATAAAGTIAVGDTAAEGVSTSFARADHRHALPAPPAPADVDHTAASAGVATTVARSDHKHDVNVAAPVATGSANAIGVATTLALSDHVHQTLIQVQDEGVLVGTRGILNFIGAGVTAVDNAGSGRVDVTIPGATDTDTAWKAFTGRVILSGAVTKYLCDNWNDASDFPLEYPVPVASHVTMMYVRVRENQANVVTHVNLFKNGVQQAQVNFNATVTGNGNTGAISIAYAAGDYFDIQVVSGGNNGDDVRVGVTLVFAIP